MTQYESIKIQCENAVLKESNVALSADLEKLYKLFYKLREENLKLIKERREWTINNS